MEGTTQSLETVMTTITDANLPGQVWAAISDVMPFVVVMVGVSIGIYFLRKIIKKASKGKAGI